MRFLVLQFLGLGLLVVLLSCQKEKDSPLAYKKEFVSPPGRNPSTPAGEILGQMLFFDSNLSGSKRQSCASCHSPQQYFTDRQAVSPSHLGKVTGFRNTPSILYAGYKKELFWDGGVANLESLPAGPLTSKHEMGGAIPNILAYLRSKAMYRQQFKAAFGTDSISSALMMRALAQYVRRQNPFRSRYDAWQLGAYTPTKDEVKGYLVYQDRCQMCHTEGLFTNFDYANVGLDTIIPTDVEQKIKWGRMRITSKPIDYKSYTVPTLRNTAKTAPYFHDGRQKTLEEVIDFYSEGVVQSNETDFRVENKPKLSRTQKRQLRAFLEMLTDTVITLH